ncbi:unnamed protein product [Lathyrus sativus]|nr:unnamed protein product [Lathyrus sativus]
MLVVMGFGERWMKWMKGGVMNNFMFVLVNGSPTHDFKISRGLRHGAPLSSFLFSVVVERLAAMVKRAPGGGLLSGFRVNDRVSYYLLQFVDDTMLICDGAW